MIKFRQKEYSGRGMRLVRGLKKTINQVDTAITNKSLEIQDKIGRSIGRKKLTPRSIKIPTKTNSQINRETIKTVRGAQETGRKILETPLNEGLDKGIRYASGNPLTAAVSVAPIPGSTVIGVAGEEALKSKLPGYARATKKLQDGYSGSKFSKGLKKLRLPSLSELPQNLPIL